MEMLKFHGQFLKKYSTEESSLLDSTEYIIQQVESRDTDRVIDLLKQKYEFHERFLFMEIVLKATEKERNKVKIDLPGIFFKMSYEYTEDLYKLAYDSFEADRRFHLEQQFDQSKAKYVKESYINRCREQGMPVFSAHKDKELLGYIIIDLHPNRENNCFQIMLGVTKSGIKGKMIAFPLYNELLNRMVLSENGGYTKYCGYISSANIASINLHHHLGAKVVEVIDEYIYRTVEKEK